jgi:hypothetical protein
MGETSKDLLALLLQLMPGFLTAWVVYGLTTYSKPPQFERVVQALIYSFIVGAFVTIVQVTLIGAGKHFSLGIWDKSVELIVSVFVALALGMLISHCVRNDGFFRIARKLGLTSRTPYPSEWYGAFAIKPRYVVLHLVGNRRIFGYPIEWPSEPTSGHFRLSEAAWVLQDNKQIDLAANDSILIEAKQVEMVEFLKSSEEIANGSKASQSAA